MRGIYRCLGDEHFVAAREVRRVRSHLRRQRMRKLGVGERACETRITQTPRIELLGPPRIELLGRKKNFGKK